MLQKIYKTVGLFWLYGFMFVVFLAVVFSKSLKVNIAKFLQDLKNIWYNPDRA